MDWLFERTIELAAWVAFTLSLFFLCETIWMLVQCLQNLGSGISSNHLELSIQAASRFVGAALAIGLLACIDHYVFDLPEEA